MIDIDKSILFQIVTFLILMWGLNYLLFRPTERVLVGRKERISGLVEEVERLRREITNKMNKYESELHGAKEEATKVKEALKKEGLEKKAEIINKAIGEGASFGLELKGQIEKEFQKAREGLKKEAEAMALSMAKRILGRDL